MSVVVLVKLKQNYYFLFLDITLYFSLKFKFGCTLRYVGLG